MKRVSRRQLARVIVRELESGRRPRPLLRSVGAYLLLHNMTDQVDLLVNDIALEYYLQSGQLTATMESAEHLSAALKNQLRTYLKKVASARSVELEETIDPSLIGGVRLRIPGQELDLTVRRQLKQLQGIRI